MSNGYPNIDNLRPLSCISGQIMRCNRIVANVFRKYLRPFNITDSQLSILFVISKTGIISQKRISIVLFLEKSSVNRNLQRLLKEGYIRSQDNLGVSMTEEGKEYLEGIIPEWEKAMAEIKIKLEEDGLQALDVLYKQLTSSR